MPTDDSLPALLDNHDQVTMRYHDCADRNTALLRAMDAWRDTAKRWYCAALTRARLQDADCTEAGNGR